MAESSRIHFLQDESNVRSLLIDQPIWSDSGIYSWELLPFQCIGWDESFFLFFRCIALNDAGQAVTSCTITIEGKD
jgi:hypothetical protein